MSKKIIAFGASNSKHSINKKLATHAANKLEGFSADILDLNDFEMAIFSIDRENSTGIPELAHQFKKLILNCDGIIISFAEHNGAYSAAFKNIFDWISRIDSNVWGQKPMLMMATSPGGRGGSTILDIALNKFKFMNSNELIGFSLPSFHKNFTEEDGITDLDLNKQFGEKLKQFRRAIEG